MNDPPVLFYLEVRRLAFCNSVSSQLRGSEVLTKPSRHLQARELPWSEGNIREKSVAGICSQPGLVAAEGWGTNPTKEI